MTAVRSYSLAELPGRVGDGLGTSDWITVGQDRIDRFAEATGDRQWVHVDPVRAAAGPYGRTIAHGFLTVSLLPEMNVSAFTLVDCRMAVNYGLDKLRFPAPVPEGSRLRGHFKLLACRPLDGAGVHLALEVTMEREGGDKPVCVAEALIRCFP
jgi:acyl dehydratase